MSGSLICPPCVWPAIIRSIAGGSSRANIETICRVLIEQVTKPIQIGDVKEWVGLSIGAYMLKRGELNLGEMLHRADLAMIREGQQQLFRQRDDGVGGRQGLHVQGVGR